MRRPLRQILLGQFGAILAWVLLSGLVGFGGVFLTGQIPFLGLGVALGCLGVLTHTLLISLNKKPAWWQVGLAFSILLGSVSLVLGTMGGDRYPLSFMVFIFTFYFSFGALIYSFVQNAIVELLIDPL